MLPGAFYGDGGAVLAVVFIATNVATVCLVWWFIQRSNKPPISRPLAENPFADFGAFERELVRLVARHGTGKWDDKASKLTSALGRDVSAASARARWVEIGPRVRAVAKKSQGCSCGDAKSEEGAPTMPCGSTCADCPTKDDCCIHKDGAQVSEIEDLCGACDDDDDRDCDGGGKGRQ